MEMDTAFKSNILLQVINIALEMQVSELQSELSETKASLKIFTSGKGKLDEILNAQILGN